MHTVSPFLRLSILPQRHHLSTKLNYENLIRVLIQKGLVISYTSTAICVTRSRLIRKAFIGRVKGASVRWGCFPCQHHANELFFCLNYQHTCGVGSSLACFWHKLFATNGEHAVALKQATRWSSCSSFGDDSTLRSFVLTSV